MNKLEALKYFCTAAESKNFREAANRLAISPSAVSRTIAELEQQLGELLFKRNSRSIQLTEFGEDFLPKAEQLLQDSEQLFQNIHQQDLQGMVRISSVRLPYHHRILCDLLDALTPYPDTILDWQIDPIKRHHIQHRIDIGVRIGNAPDPSFIVKPIAQTEYLYVAAPSLIEALGEPKDLEDFRVRYPFSGLMNLETGKLWGFSFGDELFQPKNIRLISTDPYAQLTAVLAGKTVAQLGSLACRKYLNNGQLRQLFPDIKQESWQLYLYRPYHPLTPKRVRLVFELLEKILRKHLVE
ncbi:LysR family transcriptional regulator [Avibacterium sp. 21-594]|uniref:LysR family transcriptional regulator n=1 Tax=Avibacterium sp. 21-594 TaxID=2911535 RepID=UPI0022471CA4|nr:LysR family transcriptional regulator [Avibacterium sp. 21-594]MCW9716254.1 LysR family transcriptional regulator [Avibacterium sp. 21-594]